MSEALTREQQDAKLRTLLAPLVLEMEAMGVESMTIYRRGMRADLEIRRSVWIGEESFVPRGLIMPMQS